ncbi:MAG: cob(I)yrinic acid a,c-diamide adenosyltransferase [Propionibacteriaceae bacterium]|jgi:cob(I)alamin adenosyltransferase|nr:cob(I)yrinic acid a,c-diamide adenosyltransferase [Propionibacteriaceae bacterium]
MVKLTRIYTRTGDAGRTRLVDNSVAAKTDSRVEAYGSVDELTAVLAVALDCGLPEAVAAVLRRVQQELFDVGADLANPLDPEKTGQLRILPSQVTRLEAWCDEFGDPLPALRSFLLPGGCLAGSYLHLARTVCRRAERAAWRAADDHGLGGAGGVSPEAVTYLNRLSDLLFILARAVTGVEHEVLWTPGGER